MQRNTICLIVLTTFLSLQACAKSNDINGHTRASDEIIEQQRQNLKLNTQGKGFGPQSPRDIDSLEGDNPVHFELAPEQSKMNLCNIHFHQNAEHRGGEFSHYAGNGDGKGYQSGYLYSGQLTEKELSGVDFNVCPGKYGSLAPGDTIEAHYVFTTADIEPGQSLGACFNDSTKNPQLRVAAQVYVLVNDSQAGDFVKLNQHAVKNGYHQAVNVPDNTGTPVQYTGSTTGPGYNEKGSPFQVTWSVRPKVARVDIESVANWCKSNTFAENHAHGVRNLVINPDLLSDIAD